MEKCKVVAGSLLVIIMMVLFYFAGLFTETPAKMEGPGGFIEPKVEGSGLLGDRPLHPAGRGSAQ